MTENFLLNKKKCDLHRKISDTKEKFKKDQVVTATKEDSKIEKYQEMLLTFSNSCPTK